MSVAKADIIAHLQKELLSLQGYKALSGSPAIEIGLGPVLQAFPGERFPVGAIHEFITTDPGQLAASGGFIAGIMGQLMQMGGVAIWISTKRSVFPPALTIFGVEPHHIIFIDVQSEKEALWATEEALKCNGVTAVVSEIKELNFTASRRLQLAVEQSQVTGFVIRRNPKYLSVTACLARWQVTSIHSEKLDDMPGVGFPAWRVDLLKIRNGRTGSWDLCWYNGNFQFNYKIVYTHQQQQKVG